MEIVVGIVLVAIGWIIGRYTAAQEMLKGSASRILEGVDSMRKAYSDGHAEGLKEGIEIGVEMCISKANEASPAFAKTLEDIATRLSKNNRGQTTIPSRP